MGEQVIQLLTAKEAAQYLRVSLRTLRRLEKRGQLVPWRTPGGHRRYRLGTLRRFMEQKARSRRKSHRRGASKGGGGRQVAGEERCAGGESIGALARS
jgi:excisionase family DNA binding protein